MTKHLISTFSRTDNNSLISPELKHCLIVFCYYSYVITLLLLFIYYYLFIITLK